MTPEIMPGLEVSAPATHQPPASSGDPAFGAVRLGTEDRLPWWARRSVGWALLAMATLFFAFTALEILEVASSTPAVAVPRPAPHDVLVSPDAAVPSAAPPATSTSWTDTGTSATTTSLDDARLAASVARTERRREEHKLAEIRRQIARARAVRRDLEMPAVASPPIVNPLIAPSPLNAMTDSTGTPMAEWVAPLTSYRVTARFGETGRLWAIAHTGLDLAAPTGTSVMAVAGGTVSFAGDDGAYGQRVAVTHADGTQTWYAHLSRIAVAVGMPVTPGAPLGAVGTTGNVSGPHLHIEVRPLGAEPVDPWTALRDHGVTL